MQDGGYNFGRKSSSASWWLDYGKILFPADPINEFDRADTKVLYCSSFSAVTDGIGLPAWTEIFFTAAGTGCGQQVAGDWNLRQQ